jgi:hypothetical protein
MKNILMIFVYIGIFWNSIIIDNNLFTDNEIVKLKAKNNKIEFPLFKYKNIIVSNKINQTLLDSLKEKLDVQIKTDNIHITIEKVSKTLDYCDYEIFSSKNTVSVELLFESSEGAYPTSWREYYNFSTVTGKLLLTKDIFSDREAFLIKFKKSEKIYISEYIKEITNPDSDSTNVKFAIEILNEGCFKYFDDKFNIKKDTLYFYPDDCAPHFMQNLNPYKPIKFSKIELKNILKKEYQ